MAASEEEPEESRLSLREVEEELVHERFKLQKVRRERNLVFERLKDMKRENAEVRAALKKALGERDDALGRAQAFEVAVFEERTRWAERLKRREAECLEDAIEAATEAVKEAVDIVRKQRPLLEDADLRDLILNAKKLREKLSVLGTVEDPGVALRETLFAIAHPYGSAPPLDPTQALPAAVACVDFAIEAATILAQREAPTRGVTAAKRLLDPAKNWLLRKFDTEVNDDDDTTQCDDDDDNNILV